MMRSGLSFRVGWLFAAILSAGALSAGEQGNVYPCRWFFNFGPDLTSDAVLVDVKKNVDAAAAHGLNGIIVGANLDWCLEWDDAAMARLKDLKAYCGQKGLEVIPL